MIGLERKKENKEQVIKLVKDEFIKEICYACWLENLVLVKKSNGKWRLIIDYKYLNKECTKYLLLLPNTERLVDNSFGF